MHKIVPKVHDVLFIAICAAVVGACVVSGASPETAHADTVVSVNLSSGPTDVCPNIAGPQGTLPAGMIFDASGNCVTPPPPQPTDVCANIADVQATVPSGFYASGGNCYPDPTPPPPPPTPTPTDVCANLSGIQTIVPAGYYLSNGNCLVQPTEPTPPTDVCANIDGVQSVVPDGLISDTSSNCLQPTSPVVQKDLCPNIDGTQTIVPTGMKIDSNNNCYTPYIAPEASTAGTPVTLTYFSKADDGDGSNIVGTGALENIPTPLAPVVQPIVNLFPTEARQALHAVPRVVSQTFPYATFIILVLSASLMLLQVLGELQVKRLLLGVMGRERAIAEQKDNFLMVASHYLLTPLTLIQNGTDMAVSLHEMPETVIEPLRQAILGAKTRIENVLKDLQNDVALKGVAKPQDMPRSKISFLRSPYFVLPVAISVLLTLTANFIFGVVGDVKLGAFNLLTQLLIFACLATLLYNLVRSSYLKTQENSRQKQLIAHEEAIDAARSEFITAATAALTTSLADIDKNRGVLQGTKSETFVSEGYNRFAQILHRFTLLGQVRTGAAFETQSLNVKTTLDEVLAQYQPAMNEKRITIRNDVENTNVVENPTLFRFVLGSIIDNAVKFTGAGGTIAIKSSRKENGLELHVSDTGIGVTPEKLSQLFQPFVRGTSAAQFDYEGMGFSLFLDKIIMDAAGGTIDAKSQPNEGMHVTVSSHVETEAAEPTPRRRLFHFFPLAQQKLAPAYNPINYDEY